MRAATDRSGGGRTSHFSPLFSPSPFNHAEELELTLPGAPVIMQITNPDKGIAVHFAISGRFPATPSRLAS